MPDARFRYASFLALVALCACHAPEDASGDTQRADPRSLAGPEPSAPDMGTTLAQPDPRAPVEEGDTFAYLLARYDANGDETITAAEYTRHEVQLSRWDNNGDAVLTAADFDVPEPTYAEIGRLRKARVVGRYFQADGDNETLHVEELAEAFDAYEGRDGDDVLTEGEFASKAEARRVADGAYCGEGLEPDVLPDLVDEVITEGILFAQHQRALDVRC